jgi:hypothetical protein
VARISLLQLDTEFPRIPGDVGCAETFQCELEIIRVPTATVAKIVTARPHEIDLRPFEDAIASATGDLITTSCGFLAPHQPRLAQACDAPFLASALCQLPELTSRFPPSQLGIITFDAEKLGAAHLPKNCADYACSIAGLTKGSHLRDVISNDKTVLDIEKAAADVCAVIHQEIPNTVDAILLECTNLPPYKTALRPIKNLEIFDILTAIEAQLPNAVNPRFL